MAHKTFISYKYSESKKLRDKIIDAMGDDASYYNGETSDSDDMSDESNQKIQEYLKDMLFDTSVTIVILSPEMKKSHWIDWEIEYSLKAISRDGRTSHTNGIVAVIKKVNGDYSWFKNTGTNCHEENIITYNMNKIFDIISKNHFNSKPPIWHCDICETYDWLDGSYISFIDEDDFLINPTKYVENAYQKSLVCYEKYDIKKKL